MLVSHCLGCDDDCETIIKIKRKEDFCPKAPPSCGGATLGKSTSKLLLNTHKTWMRTAGLFFCWQSHVNDYLPSVTELNITDDDFETPIAPGNSVDSS